MSLTISVSEIITKSNNPLLKISQSWSRIKLEEIASILNGFAFESSLFNNSKGMPLIRIRNIGNISTDTYYDGEFDSAYIIRNGDLLIGMDGDFKCARWSGCDALLNQRVCKINVISPDYDSKFMEYLLPGYLKAINDFTSSVTVKHLSSKTIYEIPLPLPPYNEQKRIVTKIEEFFTKLDAGVAALKKVKAELKRYRQSVLKAAFEGKLTAKWRKKNKDKLEPASKLLERIAKEREKTAKGKARPLSPVDISNMPNLPDGWEWTTMPQVGELNRGKSRHRPRNAPHLYGGKYPFVQTGDIRNANGTIKEYTQTYSEEGLNQSRLWQSGTLCITIAANIADTAFLGFDACIPDSVVGFTTKENHCNIKFVEFFLRTMKADLERYAPATAQKNINLAILSLVAIPYPSLLEQVQIVLEIERCFSITDEVEQTIEKSLEEAERLRQSILKRAFEGKLVPQNVNDEPAEVLLERIQQQKAQQQDTAKMQKKIKPKAVKASKRKHSQGIYFRRGAVLSYIVNELCDNSTFGRTQFEKIAHLTQYHLGIELEFEFKKKVAGPFDEEIHKLEGFAAKRGWFNTYKRTGTYGHCYRRGHNIEERCSAAVTILGSQKNEMDRLISFFKKFDTDRAEIFDTVYAVWNDLLIDGIEPTEDKIRDDFYAWSKEKKRFVPEKIYNCIKWIKDNKFTPVGQGAKTKYAEPADVELVAKPKRRRSSK